MYEGKSFTRIVCANALTARRLCGRCRRSGATPSPNDTVPGVRRIADGCPLVHSGDGSSKYSKHRDAASCLLVVLLLAGCHRTETLDATCVRQWRIAFEISTTYPEPLWFVDIAVDLAIVFDIFLNLRRQVDQPGTPLRLNQSG